MSHRERAALGIGHDHAARRQLRQMPVHQRNQGLFVVDAFDADQR